MSSDWQKMLSDLSITTEKPINEGLIVLAIYTDLLKTTKNPDLKRAIEKELIKCLSNAD